MKIICSAILCCAIYCDNSAAMDQPTTSETTDISQADELQKGKNKRAPDRKKISELCAEHRNNALELYNKVNNNDTWCNIKMYERHIRHKFELAWERLERIDSTELSDEQEELINRHSAELKILEEMKSEVLEELNIKKEDYEKALDNIQEYTFLPSIPDLEKSTGENEYIKVMKEFCEAYNFDLLSTRVMGRGETASIRKEISINSVPEEKGNGLMLYPAFYFKKKDWEGLVVKGKIALQVESFQGKYMAFKCIAWSKAKAEIKRIKRIARRTAHNRNAKK